MNKPIFALPSAVLVVALFAAGCGGSGDSSTTSGGSGDSSTVSGGSGDPSTASITKAEFIKKADAICKKSSEQIEAGFASFVKENAGAKKAANFEELVSVVLAPSIQNEVDEIRALGAPSGDEDQVNAFAEAVEESIEIAEGEPEAVILDSEKVFGRSSKLANEYGLKACGAR